jgi:hypothetical protein
VYTIAECNWLVIVRTDVAAMERSTAARKIETYK